MNGLVQGLADKLVNGLMDGRTDGLFWSDSIIKRELSVMLSLAIVRLHHASHSRKTLPGAVWVPAPCVWTSRSLRYRDLFPL